MRLISAGYNTVGCVCVQRSYEGGEVPLPVIQSNTTVTHALVGLIEPIKFKNQKENNN